MQKETNGKIKLKTRLKVKLNNKVTGENAKK
jgi:hypothetical protein